MTDEGEVDSEGRLRRPPDREAVHRAFQEERFTDAFSALQKSILMEALGYFAGAGIQFDKPDGEFPPEELLDGLALAASREVEARLPNCPIELMLAATAIAGIARLRLALGRDFKPDTKSTTQWIARFAVLGVELGQIDQALHMLRTGVFDTLSEAELAKERRRLGAEKTNAKKATVRQSALAEGIRICSGNHHLSTEDLALRIREAARLPTTIKTISEWVRHWRRTGLLPSQAGP